MCALICGANCALRRGAQKDLFGHSTVGDLRPYLSGFFDTSSGSKVPHTSALLHTPALKGDCVIFSVIYFSLAHY